MTDPVEPAARAELFRVLGDLTRLRIVALLAREELTVSELTETLGIGQSTVSTHLAQLRRVGLVATRRDGPHTRSVLDPTGSDETMAALLAAVPIDPADERALERIRAARVRGVAPEGLGPDYLPGRSWEALAHLLLALMPPLRVADLGVGTGRLTALLASRASRVIAIDRDPAALTDLPSNVEGRVGDIASPPLSAGEVDLAMFSQSLHCVEDPVSALRAVRPALAPGGRVAVLDLASHTHAWTRARLGHVHLGFDDLGGVLWAAGYEDVEVREVHRDRKAPMFVTLLAVGRAP